MKAKCKKMFRRLKRYVKNFFEIIFRPDMVVLPGQLAFFLALSIVPTVTLIAFIASRLNISMDLVYNYVSKLFDTDVASLIVPTLTEAPPLRFIIYLFIGYFIASNGASSIIVTSNAIYSIPNKNYFFRRAKAILMTFLMVVMFLFILIVPVFGSKVILLLKYLEIDPFIINRITFDVNFLKGPVSWFIIFLILKLLYTIAPDRKVSHTSTSYGALFTTLGWFAVTYIYSFYVNNVANYNAFYGGAANIIIMLLWLYLVSYIFVIGLAMNQRKETNDIEKTINTLDLEKELEVINEEPIEIIEEVKPKKKVAKKTTNKTKKTKQNK